MKYQLSAGCGEAALWRPLLLAQYCCQGGENNIFVKTQSHKTSQLPVSASSGSSKDVIDVWPLSCQRVTCDFFQAGHIVRGSASAAIPRSTCSLLGARVHPGAVGFSVPSAIWFTLPRPCASLRLLILSPASCVASISAPSVPLSSHGRPRIGDLASAALGSGSDLRRHCMELPSAPSDMPTDQLLPAHRQLSRRPPWAHWAVAFLHVEFSGGRQIVRSAVMGYVKSVSMDCKWLWGALPRRFHPSAASNKTNC